MVVLDRRVCVLCVCMLGVCVCVCVCVCVQEGGVRSNTLVGLERAAG